MEKEEVIIYSRATNQTIIQTPGRRFPGSVIQGDSLHNLFRLSQQIVKSLHSQNPFSQELLENAEELHGLLYERLLEYQDVLQSEGIEIPYFPELRKDDLLTN